MIRLVTKQYYTQIIFPDFGPRFWRGIEFQDWKELKDRSFREVEPLIRCDDASDGGGEGEDRGQQEEGHREEEQGRRRRMRRSGRQVGEQLKPASSGHK